jgi:sec-independent protein translocase protein TatA
MGIRGWEIIIIIFVILLIWGPSRLPGLGRGIGNFIRELRGGMKGDDDKSGKPPENSNSSSQQGSI